jgi:hypothetical protein
MEWALGKAGNAKANNYLLLLPCPDSSRLQEEAKVSSSQKG